MRYKPHTFTSVPNRDFLKGKNPYIQVIFMWLCSHIDEEGICFPSRKTLSDETGLNIKTIDKYIEEMCNLGLIKKERRIDKDQSYTSNLYSVQLLENDTPLGNEITYPSTISGATPSPISGALTKPSINKIKITKEEKISFEDFKEEKGCYLDTSTKPDAQECYRDIWYTVEGKPLSKSEEAKMKREYDLMYRDDEVAEKDRSPVKRQYLPKQPYVHNTDTDFKNPVTDLMVKTLCSKQGIPKLDGKGTYKNADELRDTFTINLEKMGVKDLGDQNLIVQFGFFLDKVKQKSDFHWNNMTSMEYINRNFYKLDKLIK